MPLTPQITLTITLDDLQGVDIGSVSNPAYVDIALAGYGPLLPRISGTAMLAKIGPLSQRIPYLGAPITVTLWGNDVITPPGTSYIISIEDDQGNVLQSNSYVFSGTVSADLSTITPSFPPPPVIPTISGGEVAVAFVSNPVFNAALVIGPITFSMTLTGNVVSPTVINFFGGQIVTFSLTQDATGSRTFAWPGNVLNAGIVNPAPLSVSVQSFIARANGNLYPIGPMTYN